MALRQSLWYSSTLGGESLFQEAIRFEWIAGSFAFAGGAFLLLSW